MSFLRKTAEKIAAGVVRYAAAGSKEWAEALSSELAYIESDWQALAWSLSGIRVLLRWEPRLLRSLEELDVAAQKYADRRRYAMNNTWLARNSTLLLLAWEAIHFLLAIIRGREVTMYTVGLLGLLLVAGAAYIQTREPVVPDRDDQPGLLRFYVDELTTSSSFSLVRFWMPLAGISLIGVGCPMLVSLPWKWRWILGAISFALIAIVLARHQSNRKRLAQITRLLSSR